MAMNGLHHAAFITKDMKAQIEFFTQCPSSEHLAQLAA